MSEIKHTPGPWSFRFEGDGGDFSIKSEATGETIVVDGLSRDFELDGPEHEQLKATVRLIAAAPVLLDALQSMNRAIEQYFGPSKSGPAYPTFFDAEMHAAWAAITKATGSTA
jgi:hypothetical protein